MVKIGAALIVGVAVGTVTGMTLVAQHIYPDKTRVAALCRFLDRVAWESMHS